MLMGIGPDDFRCWKALRVKVSGSCNDKQHRGVCFNGCEKQVDLKEPGRPGFCSPLCLLFTVT